MCALSLFLGSLQFHRALPMARIAASPPAAISTPRQSTPVDNGVTLRRLCRLLFSWLLSASSSHIRLLYATLHHVDAKHPITSYWASYQLPPESHLRSRYFVVGMARGACNTSHEGGSRGYDLLPPAGPRYAAAVNLQRVGLHLELLAGFGDLSHPTVCIGASVSRTTYLYDVTTRRHPADAPASRDRTSAVKDSRTRVWISIGGHTLMYLFRQSLHSPKHKPLPRVHSRRVRVQLVG